MAQVNVVKFAPHPLDIADSFSPISRPSLAFNVSDLFHNEMHVILLCMTGSRSTSYENIVQYARQKYIDNNINDDIAQNVLYHIIHREYAYVGNADGLWNDQNHYMKLLKYPAIQTAMRWIVSAIFSQSNNFLQYNNVDLMALERHSDLSFLFERANAVPVQQNTMFLEESPLVGQIASLTQQMSTMTSVMGRTFERLERIATERQPDVMQEAVGYPASTVIENSIDPAQMSLEQLVRRAYEINSGGAPLPVNSYSVFWAAPPPVSLTTFYTMKDLSKASRTFLIDAFLDLYNSQMCMLSIHFYLRRMAALWQRTDDIVESALFSKEMQFLKGTLSSFIEKITHQFSIKFLAMEGINLTGAKNMESLDSIFPPPSQHGSIKPVIDISAYLDSMIENVRDCCVGLERLRVSLLYGRAHPSYVGDEFLSSYLYRCYITRHATGAMETIMALTPTMAQMTLPADRKKNIEFYNTLFGNTIDSANERFVVEPEMRKHFDEKVLDLVGGTRSSGKSRTVPVTGELNSLFPSTHEGQLLMGLVEKMWTDFSYSVLTIADVPGEPVDATNEVQLPNESLIPEE